MATSAAEAQWESLTERRAELPARERASFNLADQNADDTSIEEKFEKFSARWFEVFATSYSYNLDTMNDEAVADWSF